MAPMAFNRDYLDDYLDTLWELRENISMDLDWGYESSEPHVPASKAPVDRPPLGRQAATIVRIRLHHLCPKSRDVPGKPKRPQRYCTVLVRTVTRRPSQYPRPLPRYPLQHREPRKGTPPHPSRVPKSPVNALTPPPPPTSSDRRARLYHRLKIRLH